MIDLETIKRIEPNAVEYKELSKNYMITLKDGSQVLIHKDLVRGHEVDCFECGSKILFYGRSIISYNPDGSIHQHKHKPHTHDGTVMSCWDCGREFCRKCCGEYADFSESYCGY